MKEHAALILKNDDGKILFVKRSMSKKTLPGAWSFPSGTREEGEDIYQTAKREAKEELDTDIEVEKILATQEIPEFSTKLIYVVAKLKNNPEIKQFHEIEKLEFMSFEEFFSRFSDNEIGHGLVWIRKNKDLWI